MRSRVGTRTILLLAVGIGLCMVSSASAQQAGVAVDAQGVLKMKVFNDPGGRLMQQRINAAKSTLSPQVAKPTAMRKLSLNRLEEVVRSRGGVPTDEMRYLAGLIRVKYVFYYPDTKDIVIAGPAEGWVTDPSGRVLGMTSGRPVIQLQDLIVALRAFPPDKKGAGLIGCSIDATEKGLAEMQRFQRSIGRQAVPANKQSVARFIANGMRTSLGMQNVSVQGIPPNTHFAQVMVEADYRMKLIGIGLERPPVRLVSWVERVKPSQVRSNAMQRWYFVPDYNCVRVSDDGLAMQMVGDGVKLIGEDEFVAANGQRHASARKDAASQAFVTSFTKKYSELAERSPVYAELRNLIDMSVAAAYIQKQNYYQKAGWNMPFFGDEQQFHAETYNAPKQVASAINALWKGHQLMTPIGGGVSIHARKALESSNTLPDEKGKVAELRKEIKLNLAKGQWWWN